MVTSLASTRSRLIAFAAALPGAHEDFPWGERVMKVGKKVFVFLGSDDDAARLSLSVKLPHSSEMALGLPFATPTSYGLGKSGWVTARIDRSAAPPFDLLRAWVEESYRAIAPKKLLAALAEARPPITKTSAPRSRAPRRAR